MGIRFDNDYTKQWLARRGPAKVFGQDVDTRERLNDKEAVEWFDRVWKSSLERAVQTASLCDIGFVRSKVPPFAQRFINDGAQHREFIYATCFFICQFVDAATCDQLWFIPSSSPDPRTLYVRFESLPIKEEFDKLAKQMGWSKPEELGLKLVLDFMESVTRQKFREAMPSAEPSTES